MSRGIARLPAGLALAWLTLAAVPAPAADPAAEAALDAALARGDYAQAAGLLRDALAATPDDEGLRFELARTLGQAGDYPAAIAEYESLIAASPGNVDYAFGRAQALAWANRDQAALEEVGRARRLAPDYEAVWQLEHRLLARGGPALSGRLAAFREQAAMRFPAAAWWAATAAPTPAIHATEILISGVRQSLSTPVPDWRTSSVRVTRRRSPDLAYFASWQREERFGASDTLLGGGLEFRPAADTAAGIELELGSDTDFMPELAFAGWASPSLAPQWETVFRVRHRRYAAIEVTSTAGTAARYFGRFRAAYTLDIARLHGADTSLAHIARLDYYRHPGWSLNLTLAQGEEAEAIAPGTVLRTDVRAITLGARHSLGERWQIDWWLGSHRQGNFYRRQYVGLALAIGL